MGITEHENPAQPKPVLCWCCETKPAVVCNSVPGITKPSQKDEGKPCVNA